MTTPKRALYPHDADLLRQRRAARRARLHDDRRRRADARAPARGPRRLLPDRHRRARAEHRADRARAGHLRAGALRPHLGARSASLWDRYDIRYDRFIRTTEDVHRRGVLKLWERLRAAKTPDGQDAVYRGKYAAGTARAARASRTRTSCASPATSAPTTSGPASGPRRRTSSSASRPTRAGCARRDRVRPAAHRARVAPERGPGRHPAGAQGLQRQPRPREVGDPGPRAARPRPLRLGGRAQRTTSPRSASRTTREAYRHYWAGGDERLHLIGKDIIRFHCLYWPAILHAAGVPVPDARVRAGLHHGERHASSSKTTGNVIDPVALVERLRARRRALLPPARGALRAGLGLHGLGLRGPLQRRPRERPRQPRLARAHDGREATATGRCRRGGSRRSRSVASRAVDFTETFATSVCAPSDGLAAKVLGRYEDLDFAGALGEIWSWIGAAQPGDRAGRAVGAREGPGAPRRARGASSTGCSRASASWPCSCRP